MLHAVGLRADELSETVAVKDGGDTKCGPKPRGIFQKKYWKIHEEEIYMKHKRLRTLGALCAKM